MTYQRIKELRESNNLTQKDICKVLYCSQQVYSDYELGKLDIPTEVLINLSKYYNVSTDYILNLTNNKEAK